MRDAAAAVKVPRGKANWRRFVSLVLEAKPPKLILVIAFALSLLATGANLLIPLFTKNLVNGFSLSDVSAGHMWAMGAAFVAQVVCGGVSVYLLNYSGSQVVAAIRERVWRKIVALPVAYYDQHQTGATVSRLTNDTAVMKTLVSEQLTGFLTGMISIVGSLALMLYMNWQLTLTMLVVFPVAALIMVPVGRGMYKVSKGIQAETAEFTSVASRVVSEIRLVKASGAEGAELVRGIGGIGALLRFGMKEARLQAVISPLVTFIMLLLLVSIIGFGAVQISSGAMTAGALVAFIMYLFQIIMPLTQITQFFTQFQKTMGATDSIMTMLEAEEENAAKGVSVVPAGQPIEVDGVSFAYKEGEAILQDVRFTIQPGKVTAIVGPSGGGKTTLFSLLERFYEPTSGAIRLGRQEISGYSLQAWRRQIGYVSQESPLIAGTIRDNITYGMERDVPQHELEQAARMAYADGFIRELPLGYETEVGERGIKLSGGQRQRIAIARALLRNPQILMLDEATSNLDSRSEEVVQQALHNLMNGRTTVVIAHRLSTVVDADRIVFMEKGRVTGSGTHEELYQTHAMYRQFADQQLRSKLPSLS